MRRSPVPFAPFTDESDPLSAWLLTLLLSVGLVHCRGLGGQVCVKRGRLFFMINRHRPTVEEATCAQLVRRVGG